MMYRASYLAVALTLGLLLTLGMGALEKHRYDTQNADRPTSARPPAGSPEAAPPEAANPDAAAENGPAREPQLTSGAAASDECDEDLSSNPAASQPTVAASAESPTVADVDFDALVEQLEPSPPRVSIQLTAAVEPALAAEPAPASGPVEHVVNKPIPEPEIQWSDDYQQAWTDANEEGRMLFVLFVDKQPSAAERTFESQTFSRADIKAKLAEFVALRLPVDAKITSEGKSITLLKHPAFAEMLGQKGIAVIDLAHRKAEYFGHVVSTFPFVRGKYYRGPSVDAILSLPPGTLTQRTMIYAVRTHPEAPASTQGNFHNVLADEARRQSDYQAAILVQGHQNWENRFQRIARASGATTQEVVAESWPNESLVDACADCVASWRQSPGHWNAVRTRHPLFGFDIKRGSNGIWYATGIFGRR